jgi:hypothetical protein
MPSPQVDIDYDATDLVAFSSSMRTAYESGLKKINPAIMETSRVTAGTPARGSVVLPLTTTFDSRTSSSDLTALQVSVCVGWVGCVSIPVCPKVSPFRP